MILLLLTSRGVVGVKELALCSRTFTCNVLCMHLALSRVVRLVICNDFCFRAPILSAKNKDTKQIPVFEGLERAQREGGRIPAHPTLSPHPYIGPPV